ncbi:MAG TPA: alpha/beta hydrolase [Acidimicrobiales bacterium]
MTSEATSGSDGPGDVVLDAEIAASLARAPAQSRLSAGTLDEARLARDALYARLPRSDAVERVDHVVSENPRVVVRVHRPKGVEGPLPCAYSMHGGGYVIGSYEMDDIRFDALCPRVPCVGVAVNYRLAPETPYPGPLDDCYAGLRWTFEHADELGIDAERIGVVGNSAGGGLAAALALLARDRGELRLAFQLLECPMIDDRQITSSSRRDGLPIWSREENEFGWRSYLGERYGSEVDPYAAAARSTDLAGLPPTLVIVGTADGFCDENVDYASRLNQVGVPTDLHVLAGVPHGIAAFARSGARRRWAELVESWLERQVGRF